MSALSSSTSCAISRCSSGAIPPPRIRCLRRRVYDGGPPAHKAATQVDGLGGGGSFRRNVLGVRVLPASLASILVVAFLSGLLAERRAGAASSALAAVGASPASRAVVARER